MLAPPHARMEMVMGNSQIPGRSSIALADAALITWLRPARAHDS
jgi:hypothetical protein